MEPLIQYAKTSDGVSIAYWALGSGMPFVPVPQPRIAIYEMNGIIRCSGGTNALLEVVC